VCIWSHALAKKGSGVQSALDHLEENDTWASTESECLHVSRISKSLLIQ
jgi:hypothetical protein